MAYTIPEVIEYCKLLTRYYGINFSMKQEVADKDLESVRKALESAGHTVTVQYGTHFPYMWKENKRVVYVSGKSPKKGNKQTISRREGRKLANYYIRLRKKGAIPWDR